MKKKNGKHITLLTMILITGSLSVLAQPGNGGGDPFEDGDPGTPVDGGVIALIGAAAVYGCKNIGKTKSV